jgi:multisubunit Na+/H+ antiporter MnhC subunit
MKMFHSKVLVILGIHCVRNYVGYKILDKCVVVVIVVVVVVVEGASCEVGQKQLSGVNTPIPEAFVKISGNCVKQLTFPMQS